MQFTLFTFFLSIVLASTFSFKTKLHLSNVQVALGKNRMAKSQKIAAALRTNHRVIVLHDSPLQDCIPSAYPDKAKLRAIVSGPHSTNALFRAELKKELTFYRGCPAFFAELDAEKVLIITEGKSKQLEKFIGWLKSFSTPLVQRKPSFQGPSLMVCIDDLQWEEFKGDLQGFTTGSGAPQLTSLIGDATFSPTEGHLDARAMTGTDESV